MSKGLCPWLIHQRTRYEFDKDLIGNSLRITGRICYESAEIKSRHMHHKHHLQPEPVANEPSNTKTTSPRISVSSFRNLTNKFPNEIV